MIRAAALAWIALLGHAAPVAAVPAEDGRALVTRLECARCHDGVAGAPAAPDERHCVRCHRRILDGTFAAPPAALDTWRGHLRSLTWVPSLVGVARTLRRTWVRDFLLRPHDLRPALPATMPRLPISPAQADTLAAWLVPEDAAARAPLAAEDGRGGEAIYRRAGCGACHHLTGAAVEGPRPGGPAPPPEVALAPDLSFARARLQPGALEALLASPRDLKPDARMPTPALSVAERRTLAAWLLTTPLAPPAPRAVPARLPLLARRVGWDEVSARVFRVVCWHCHSQPDYALGDGGPGNTGGFGFPARGLDLSSAAGAAAGAVDEGGRRHSIFTRLEDGTPALIARLLLRQREEAGQANPVLRGMPLGLPALSPEQIQLVESWVAQGRPR